MMLRDGEEHCNGSSKRVEGGGKGVVDRRRADDP